MDFLKIIGYLMLTTSSINSIEIKRCRLQGVLDGARSVSAQLRATDLIIRTRESALLEWLDLIKLQALKGILIPIAGYWTLQEVGIAPRDLGEEASGEIHIPIADSWSLPGRGIVPKGLGEEASGEIHIPIADSWSLPGGGIAPEGELVWVLLGGVLAPGEIGVGEEWKRKRWKGEEEERGELIRSGNIYKIWVMEVGAVMARLQASSWVREVGRNWKVALRCLISRYLRLS
jgi:hypothetical protein